MRLTAQQIMRILFLISKWCKDQGVMDAMELALEYRDQYEDRIDWHEFSYLLDSLSSYGYVILVGHTTSRMCRYRMARGD